MDARISLCRFFLLDPTAVGVEEDALVVVWLAKVEVFVDGLDADVEGRRELAAFGAHESVPAGLGFVAEAGGDSFELGKGIVVFIIFCRLVSRVVCMVVDDLLGVVHHLLHIDDKIGFQECALPGVEREAVVGERDKDGGVEDVVPDAGEGHDGVEAEGEEGLLVAKGDDPEGVVGGDIVVDGRQHPVALAVDKAHVASETVVDGAMAVVEDVAVVRDIVFETTVDDEAACGVDKLDAALLLDRREALGEDPGVLVDGLDDEATVAHVEVTTALAIGEVDQRVALKGMGNREDIPHKLLAMGIGNIAVLSIIVAVVEENIVGQPLGEIELVVVGAKEFAEVDVDIVEEPNHLRCSPEENGHGEGAGHNAAHHAPKLRTVFHAEQGGCPVDKCR